MRVLLVCMGNICRSPMAEGMLRQRVAGRSFPLPVEIDSAGTHGYHDGSRPDPRAQAAAERRGFDISTLRARRVIAADFERFDLLVAMDDDNVSALLEQAGRSISTRSACSWSLPRTRGAGMCRIPTTAGRWASSGCLISSRRPWRASSTNWNGSPRNRAVASAATLAPTRSPRKPRFGQKRTIGSRPIRWAPRATG